jgi:hypothetical protein
MSCRHVNPFLPQLFTQSILNIPARKSKLEGGRRGGKRWKSGKEVMKN